MKKFFRRKSRANSEGAADVRVFDRRLSLPSHQDIQVLHTFGHGDDGGRIAESADAISPTATAPANSDDASVASAALSETETLAQTKQHRLDLQDCYQDNFTGYLPFLIRQLRRERQRQQEMVASVPQDVAVSLSDEATVASSVDSPYAPIMRRSLDVYNYKRTMIVATEFIKHITFVFADAEAFTLFKHLRSNNKKLRKNSTIIYDGTTHEIKRIRGRSVSEGEGTIDGQDDLVVDTRQHLIPLEYKLKGAGLPLFKIVVPYMSSFRKKVPYMVFKRYKEVPDEPHPGDGDDTEKFETYDFCTVYLKTFQHYKRYTMELTVPGQPPLRLLAFQNNFRPYTDFEYKNTRFRVLGSAIATAYMMNYNPELKLFILDDDMPSLIDNLVNKPPGVDLKALMKRRGSTSEHSTTRSSEEVDNPVPDPQSPIILENETGFMRVRRLNYIPSDMPPFGQFLDSCSYCEDLLLLPKKYSEVGKLDLYQNPAEIEDSDYSSTLSVDMDLLVLLSVLLVLRETNLRSSNRYTNASLMGRLGGFPGPGMAGMTAFPTSDAGWPFSAN